MLSKADAHCTQGTRCGQGWGPRKTLENSRQDRAALRVAQTGRDFRGRHCPSRGPEAGKALKADGLWTGRWADVSQGRGERGAGAGRTDRQPLTWATADGSPGQVETNGSLEGPGCRFEPYLAGKGSPRILRLGLTPIPGSELQAKRARHSAIGLQEGAPEAGPLPTRPDSGGCGPSRPCPPCLPP